MNIEEQEIPVKIYMEMRIACGLSAKTFEASQIGLKNSIHSIIVKVEEDIIGMGRIIGDGGCFCQIVDICVLPEYQKKGIGKMIINNLMDFIYQQLPSSCYISLIADGDASFLYEKFGFKDTLPISKGMFLKI